ncbi:MAG: LLM class F420-dependent oxidoreductase, partial [Acidimicrobiales bacterium]
DDPIAIGAIAPTMYVGTPTWELRRYDMAGPPEGHAERLRSLGDMGVNHVQIRFRNRSLTELLDQMDAFAADVAPLL